MKIADQARGLGDLDRRKARWTAVQLAHVAQLVEHVLGKDEVTSSNLVVGSKWECVEGRDRRI